MSVSISRCHYQSSLLCLKTTKTVEVFFASLMAHRSNRYDKNFYVNVRQSNLLCLSILNFCLVYLRYCFPTMNRLIILKNVSRIISEQQCSYLSTSPILHSWFVRLTNVTQVNSEAGVPKHTRKRNYPLTCKH